MGTLLKGLEILEAVQKNGGELALKDLAEITGLNIGTTYRVVMELTNKGYLHQQYRRGKYSLGIKLLQFSNAENYAATLKSISMPHLKHLSNEVSEISAVVVLNNLEGIDIAINFHPQSLVVNMDIFGRSPLHCTSVGKVLLADMDDGKIKMVINQGLKAYTKNTITDPEKLLKEIEVVRKENVAFDWEEYALNICSIGAPIRMKDGKVIAAVCIVAPIFRVDRQKLKEFKPIIEKYATKISKSLG